MRIIPHAADVSFFASATMPCNGKCERDTRVEASRWGLKKYDLLWYNAATASMQPYLASTTCRFVDGDQ